MLIINADDFGRNRTVTDNSLLCFENGRITSASAMVFMADSQRAADLALQQGLDAGLHLNFTLKFTGSVKLTKVSECQHRIASFLRMSKYCSLFYNPWLKRDFEYVYNAQYEEYVRLYNKNPTHIDGHHHMHLCTNVLVSGLIPKGSKVRRSFTFSSREKNVLNRCYRRLVNTMLTRRYTCTDLFFNLSYLWKSDRLQSTVNLAKYQNVELMVHPDQKEEFAYLMSDEYFHMISLVKIGNYGLL
jgi:predicted glycoside hydrolase/deacetylase ChbG (UPF0249 family)